MTSENMSPEVAQTSANDTTSNTGSDTSSAQPTETAKAATTTPQIGGNNAQAATPPSVEGQQAAQAPPSWQPNYKFKAFDKEHEIDPMFRTLIKDVETEKQIRKFHEKAFALEPMKADRDRVRTEYDTYKTQNEPTLRAVSQLNKFLANKDYDNFFSRLKITDEDIFAYAKKRLDLRDMPPDQRAEFEMQNQIRMENYQLENRYSEMEEKFQKQMVQSRLFEFNQVLSRPDVSSYEQAWDQKAGESGAFKNLIISEAQAIFQRTGEDVSAEQAINHVIQKFGRIVQPSAANVVAPGQPEEQMSQPGQFQGQQSQQAQRPPIIPNVAGKGTSPVKKRPQSLDDLRALVKNM